MIRNSKNTTDLDSFSMIIPTSFGSIGIVSDEESVSKISFLPHFKMEKNSSDPFSREISRQIAVYLVDPTFVLDFPVKHVGTEFQHRVWKKLRSIPIGETYTYSDLSRLVQSSPRAVGRACATNALALYYPCHRVVSSNGIGGFYGETDSGGTFLDIKRWLLKHEKAISD